MGRAVSQKREDRLIRAVYNGCMRWLHRQVHRIRGDVLSFPQFVDLRLVS